MSIIYCISNNVNCKLYIGQTMQPLQERFRQHNRQTFTKSLIHDAMQKYGKEHFQIKPLDEVDPALVDQSEILWIAKLNTLHPYGYNLDAGGQRKRPSKFSRQRRRKAHLGNSLSADHRAAISASLKGKTYAGHWFIVTDPSGETQRIQNLREFCTLRSLNYNSIRCALRRKRQWKGWNFQRI